MLDKITDNNIQNNSKKKKGSKLELVNLFFTFGERNRSSVSYEVSMVCLFRILLVVLKNNNQDSSASEDIGGWMI